VRFGKAARLRRRREFLAVKERGTRLHAGDYVILAAPNERGRARIGLTVSSKVGGAVVRNRVKRWLRESFRAIAGELPAVDLVVIARSSAPRAGAAAAAAALAAARRALAGVRR
jgi:ribonuclease P protein component